MLANLDTYPLMISLRDAGISEQQARVQIETITKIVDEAIEQAHRNMKINELATKYDIHNLQLDIKNLELKHERDLKELELNIGNQIKNSRYQHP